LKVRNQVQFLEISSLQFPLISPFEVATFVEGDLSLQTDETVD